MADFFVKDATTIRDDILRTLRNGLIARGVASPQLGPGSHEYVLATAVANELAVVGSNTQVKADAQMPDTAIGADLDRLTNQYGLTRRNEGPSVGYVTLETSANTFIALGSQLSDQSGQRYQVTIGGVYTNTAPLNQVPVQSIDAGFSTNHEADDVLTWVSTPAYAQPTALVSTTGISGGVDAEGDEDLRARFFSRLQNPPNNANWAQIAAIAEDSSPYVQKAFVYPAHNGPSTVGVALTAAPAVLTPSIRALNSTSKNRDVDATVLSGTIAPYISGQLPEYVEVVTTTVLNVPNDCAIGLSLPEAATSSTPGDGTGWLDASPWPVYYSLVSAVTSSTVFTVAETAAPLANVTHIAFLDPSNWTLYRSKVTAVSGIAGAWVITVDNPMPNIAVGVFVWPDCVNAEAYCDSVLASFGKMGPGERVPVVNQGRAYRHPVPQNSWPTALNATQLRALSNVGAEVLDVSWLYRGYSVVPAVAASPTAAPNIYTPRNIGFYKIIT
jgi:uncharacterized phage protein gp47/JayE